MPAAAILLSVLLAQSAPQGKIVKQTFGSGGRTRSYYLLVPEQVRPDAPLLILLHGSGREGRSLVEPWAALAREHGIILAAPDAFVPEGWTMKEDGPDFLYALIEMLRVEYPVDPRRVYLFGHSAGAIHGLAMAVLESEYFAAAAVHAGILSDGMRPLLARAPRKTPIAIWVGTNDQLFPLKAVRNTRDALQAAGFAVELTEVSGHTHAYYDRALEINKKAWVFLQKHRLDGDPKFQRYETR
jgi:poly(3-hydroxybutyrate) depolymerase